MGRFIKGLVKDTSAADQPQGTWRFARNVIINKVDGAVSNEGGNKPIVNIGRTPPIFTTVNYPDTWNFEVYPATFQSAYTETTLTGWGEVVEGYTVIGAIEVTDDRIVLFSVNRYAPIDPNTGTPSFSSDYGRSEVGVYSAGEYHTVLNIDMDVDTTNDLDLKFNANHPISGTYKVDAQDNLFVYWTDKFNPPRCLNITRQEKSTEIFFTEQIYDVNPATSPNKNYVDRLNLFPHSGPVPHVDLKSINSGGGLTTGAYSLALAYVDVDLVATNFLTVDNPVSITDDIESVLPIERYDGAEPGMQTGKSITWSISNINTDYDYIRPVIIQTVGGDPFAYQLNDIEITTTDTEITFTGIEGYTQSSIEEVIIDTVNYSIVKTLEQLDGVLYAGNLEGSLDVGFQKYAGKIKLKPKLKRLNNFDEFSIVGDNLDNGFMETDPPEADRENGYKSIKNAYKYRGYTRDEVYAFYIAFILNDGTMSYAYHIPGKKYESYIDEFATVHETLYPKLRGLDSNNARRYNFRDTSADSATSMNYWRNDNELYPNTDDYSADDFEDTNGDRNVRHHHFPSNSSEHRFYVSTGGESVNHETANVDLVWYSEAGGGNVEYGNSDITTLGFEDSNGEPITVSGTSGISMTAIYVENYQTLSIGLNYDINWGTDGWFGSSDNNFVGELISITQGGWCLFDYVSGPNMPNNTGNSESNWMGATITLVSGLSIGEYENVTSGTINSEINILGFELEDIEIPANIANKVQGFRIYYAKREHKHKTILGQGVVTPYFASFTQIGGCIGSQGLGNGNDEDLWTKFPFHTSGIFNNWNGFQGHSLNASGLRTLAFYNFELLRTKDSIAQATHFSVEGTTSYHTWLGSGAVHGDSETDCSSINIITSTFGVMSDYNTSTDLSEARFNVLNERCKSYVKGNSIFDARGLGFGYKLYNRGGESHIALGLDASQELDAVFFDESSDSSITTWNTGGVPFNYLPNTRLQTYNINLRAFKTDVYNSLDSQDLVWTGFEVVGDDLNNFITGSTYTTFIPTQQGAPLEAVEAPATFNTKTVTSEGIFGGDTFICRYGIRQTLYPNLNNSAGRDRVGGLYTIIETTDNINFRHETGKETSYFPGSPAKKFLFADRAGEGHDPENFYDYTDPENTKYNGDYSLVNDIRPAFPLPLLTSQPTSFPTRIQRSAKSDPGSLIDNFRVFLALQYKDMPKNRGSIWNLTTFNNLLYMHMEDSLFASKGKEKLQLGDASEAFIGSGDIFVQDPDELIQTEAGHGGTRSQYASLVTKYGYFSVDRRNKKVYLTSDQMQDISNLGMEKWFQTNMPFSLFNEYGYIHDDDSPINGLGYTSVWDERNQRILLTKRDLLPSRDFQRRFNAGRPADDPLYEEYIPDEVINEDTNTITEEAIIQREDIDFTILSSEIGVAPASPTYVLSSDESDNIIDEAENVIFTLTTTNVEDGAQIPYTISGVDSSDITIDGQSNPNLNGYFTISSNTDSITIVAVADNTTEADPENLVLTLGGEGAGVAIAVNITDVSLTEAIRSITSSINPVNEGVAVIFTLSTSGISDSTTIAYTLGRVGSGDFDASDIVGGSLAGNFTIVSNAAAVTVTILEDFIQEGNESFTLDLTAYDFAVTISINDTSQTAITPDVPIVGEINASFGGIVAEVSGDSINGYSGFVVHTADTGTTALWDASTAAVGALATGGFSDWVLPTKEQLEEIYRLFSIDEGEFTDDFNADKYWSSTLSAGNDAWYIDFNNGTLEDEGKANPNRVRAIRNFSTVSTVVTYAVGDYIEEKRGYVAFVEENGLEGFVVADTDFKDDTDDSTLSWDIWNNMFPFTFEDSEWSWPTITQLEQVYTVRTTLEAQPGFNAINDSSYWSSSEDEGSNAWRINFENGVPTSKLMTSNYRVRGIKAFNYLSRSIKSTRSVLDSTTNISYEFETDGDAQLNSVTSNSFTLENIADYASVHGIRVYIPATYLSFPLVGDASYTHTVGINLIGTANLLDGSGIELGDVSIVNAEGDENAEDTITSSEQTFTPTDTEGIFEVYFKINLDSKQIVTYTLNTFNIVSTINETSNINKTLTQNGAIVLNRNINKFELIGYKSESPYYQTRTAIDVEESYKIQGLNAFIRTGWTVSYYPETKFWGSFHDYIPSLYTYDSGYIYSFDNFIEDLHEQVWGENIFSLLLLDILVNSTANLSINTDGSIGYIYDSEDNQIFTILLASYPELDSTQTYKLKATLIGEGVALPVDAPESICRFYAGEDIVADITNTELYAGPVEVEVIFSDINGYITFSNSNVDHGLSIKIVDLQILPLSYWDTESTFNTMWQHDDFNEPGNFYGTLYPFEIEFIDNTERQLPKLFSSFGYETDVYNSTKIFEDGFTSFIVYNSVQSSGHNDIKYFKSDNGGKPVRKVANEWRINEFRDLADTTLTSNNYTSSTVTSSQEQSIFNVEGMYESINDLYIDINKPWHQQKKFIDTYVGIRLINSNSRKNLVNLYSTSVAMRKYNR